MKKLSDLVVTIRNELAGLVTPLDREALCEFIRRNVGKFRSKVQQTHERKLKQLGAKLVLSSCEPSKVIFNFSNYVLSDRENFLLSFGLHFSLPILKLSFYKYFLSMEKLVKILENCNIATGVQFQTVKDQIRNKAFSLFYGFRTSKVFSPIINRTDLSILRNLGKNKDLIICPPDKGRGIVLLNRTDYNEKMHAIVDDQTKFSTISNATPFLLTLRLEDKINRFLSKLKNIGTITEELYRQLYVSGSSPGILYGLAKIHKANIPLRPILAAYKTTVYKLGKFLVPLIESFSKNEYSLQNSYDFYDSIVNNRRASGFLVSYDVSSLYTNVPISESISILCDKIFDNSTTEFHGFNKADFKQLLELTLNNSYFFFDNILYKQLDGLAMGNPIAPCIANIFLCHLEEKIFRDCPTACTPNFYRRYLDDTFVTFDNENQAHEFLNYINNLHPNIQFTMEVQHNNSLSFLDLQVTTNNSQISTSIYRKPTFTGLCLSFFSCCPLKFKINSIRTLIHRGYHLSSSYINFQKEIEFLQNFFSENGYPVKLVERQIHKFLDNIFTKNQPVTTVPKQKIYVPLPYIGPQSCTFEKDLKNILNRSYPQCDFHFSFTNTFTIGSLFKFKDNLPADLCSLIIYKYQCESCQDFYIGSTKMQSKVRFCQHLGISPRTNRHVTSPLHSTPRIHCENNSHPFKYSNFSIIDKASSEQNLRILESLYIYKESPTLNLDKSCTPLNIINQ